MPASSPAVTASPVPKGNPIDDILGLYPSAASTSAPAPTATLFDTSPVQSPPPPAPIAQAPGVQSYTAYEKNGLKITLSPQTSPAHPGVVLVLTRFYNTGPVLASGLNFQAAVPKSQQLQLSPMSNPNVGPGATETQKMKVTAPAGVGINSVSMPTFADICLPEHHQVKAENLVYYRRTTNPRPG